MVFHNQMIMKRVMVSVALLYAAVTVDSMSGDWAPQDTSGGFSHFHTSTHAFNEELNREKCEKRIISVPFNSAVSDYYALFIDQLAYLKYLEGGTLKLATGVYVISHQITVPSSTCIMGAGIELTTIKLIDKAAQFLAPGVLRVVSARHVTLKQFTLDGNRGAQQFGNDVSHYGHHGLYIEHSLLIYIQHIRVINNSGYGISVTSAESLLNYYIVIERTQCNSNGYDGIFVARTMLVSLLNISATHNARHAILIAPGSRYLFAKDTTLTNNGAVYRLGCGIAMYGTRGLPTGDIKIHTSQLTDNKLAAVCLNGTHDVYLYKIEASQHDRAASCFLLRNTLRTAISHAVCTAAQLCDADARPTTMHNVLTPQSPEKCSGEGICIVSVEKSSDRHCAEGVPDTLQHFCCPRMCDSCEVETCVNPKAAECCPLLFDSSRHCSANKAPCIMR